MKKAILTTVIVLNALAAYAQEPYPKLKLHAANAGIGIFYIDMPGSDDGGGVDFMADVTCSLDKNLFGVSYLTGAEVGILGESNYNFHEVCALYGREWRPAKWFALEGFAGLGYYNQNTDFTEYDDAQLKDGNGISVPLRLNTKVYFGGSLGIGLNTNYSINAINNHLSVNFLFHYRFN